VPLSKAPAEARQRLARLLDHPSPHVELAELDTPVVRMPGLDAGRARVWVKRDELNSQIYGGGKVRKLEYVLADPRYRERHILGVGATGSHQLVALALFHAARGGKLSALIFDQEPTAAVRDNFELTQRQVRASGGRIDHVGSRSALSLAWLRNRVSGSRAIYLTPGASNAVGCLGFVGAGFELAAQIRSGLCPRPSRVYLAAGTAGSAAGLAIGLSLCDVSTELRLVSSVERWAFNGPMFRLKLREVYAGLRTRGLEGPSQAGTLLERAGLRWSIISEAVGRGYGRPTSAALGATRLAERNELRLETTYTGKCLAAMRGELDMVRAEDVLFWNTHAGRDLRPFLHRKAIS
jgi:D-cysteine desulfhydrase